MSNQRDSQWRKPVRSRHAEPKSGRPWANHVAPNRPGVIRYLSKLDLAREKTVQASEHLDRVAAVAGPILAREGYPPGAFIPDRLMTDLVLAGKEMDARWVKHYTEARAALTYALRAEERAAAAERAAPPPPPRPPAVNPGLPAPTRVRLAPAGPPVGLKTLPPAQPWHRTVPPWEDGPAA